MKKVLFLIFVFIVIIQLVSGAYTAPPYNSVNLTLKSVYAPDPYNSVNLTFGEYEAEQESKITNQESANTSIYLLMKIQYYNSTDWLDEAVVYYAPEPIRINSSGTIALDQYWNPASWNTSARTPGNGVYRAYIAGADENNVTLLNKDG